MAIATLAAYKEALANQRQRGLDFQIINATRGAGRLLTTVALNSGQFSPAWTVPTTAVVPARDATGALGQENPSSGQLSIVGSRASAANNGVALLVDILSHQGGLVGNVATAQTTNLPTAALTRYTSGEGVMMALSIYTAIGATGTTVSVSYTNSAGTSGRTSPLVAFGGTNFNQPGNLILLPLAAGDTGVRSVESVTVTATTGTAGNFGVTLFKPLGAVDLNLSMQDSGRGFVTGGFFGGIPTVENDACVALFFLQGGTNAQSTISVLVAEN